MPPPPPPGPNGQRATSDLIWRLHEARGELNATCGLRFRPGDPELRVQMDLHFRRNMRGKASGLAPASRRWCMPLDEWLVHTPQDVMAEADKAAASSAFDTIDQAAAGEKKGDEGSKPVHVV